MAEDESKPSARGQKLPAKLEVTIIRRMIGVDWDEKTGRKLVHAPGEDVKFPRNLALRLAGANPPRVAIGKDDRGAAKKHAKRAEEVQRKRRAAKEAALESSAGPRRGGPPPPA